MDYQLKLKKGQKYLEVKLRDYDLVRNPLLNKGSAFNEDEREDFGLFGLLPPTVTTLENQCQRSYRSFSKQHSDIDKYIYLRSLQDSNEVLFYRLLCEHITEMMPIVYTPTVGQGCRHFSHLYRRSRGLFIAYPYKNFMDKIFKNHAFDKVEVIVVSDGERILGLGDQGIGGMGIPIGKLSLYTACAGLHPATTLPILLDTGTNNQDLLNDPLYMGWRHERIRGADYDEFVDAFIRAVKKRFPQVLLQWEDFAQHNANPLLRRYQDQLCTFNDDIQGTAAVATGALLAAVEASHMRLCDQRIVIVGAGSAGCGISALLVQAMKEEGLSEKEARSRFYLVDARGLLLEGAAGLLDFQKPFAQERRNLSSWTFERLGEISLQDVIKNVKPTVLVGASGQGGLFTEELVRLMASQVERPIIFPLSNPTSKAEAHPEDLLKWTQHRVIMGFGSPFADLDHEGQKIRIDQANNAYIFPGLGLGVIAVQARRVTEALFMAAAKALAACSPIRSNPKGNLLPPLTEIRQVSFHVAVAVARAALAEGLTQGVKEKDIEALIKDKMWTPHYVPYRRS